MRPLSLSATYVALNVALSMGVGEGVEGVEAALSTTASLDRRQESGDVDSSVFLRRAYHRSAVLDGWLYIDGGEFAYRDSNKIRYQYSTTLLAIDLSKDFTSTTLQIRTISKPREAPSVQNGGIWVDEANKRFYTGFSGQSSDFGDGAYQPTGLWMFTPDGKGSGSWSNLNSTAPVDFKNKPRPFYGHVASGNGKGYYLGGYEGNFTAKITNWNAIPGMLTYDFNTNKVKNETVPLLNGGRIQQGQMVYVPNFGPQGILVSIGGTQVTNMGDSFLSMSTVQVFDTASEKWYEQTTRGSAPQPRKGFCAAGVASNNKTFDVFFYSGWGGKLGTKAIPFDEVYVLSLPSFRWFKADYKPTSPRHGATCHSVGNGKIIIVGGADTTIEVGAGTWAYDGVFTSSDPFRQGIGLFDLGAMKSNDSYSASDARRPNGYTMAADIQSFYNNNDRYPAFDSPALRDVFAVENFTLSATNSTASVGNGNGNGSSGDSSSPSVGAIVGGVVGGIAGIGIIVAAVAFLFLQKKKKKSRQDGGSGTSAASIAPSGTTVYAGNNDVVYAKFGSTASSPNINYEPVPQDREASAAELPSAYDGHLYSAFAPSSFAPSQFGSAQHGQQQHQQQNHYHQQQQQQQQQQQEHQKQMYAGQGYGVQHRSQSTTPDPHYQAQQAQAQAHAQAQAQAAYQQTLSPNRTIHEVQGHQDGRAPTAGEDNFKYNLRFL